MLDLFSYSPLKQSYASIYGALSSMRELFHQTGRFDDSNAKLDEVAKLLATYLAFTRGLISEFPEVDRPNSVGFIAKLQASFGKAVELECYRNLNGTSIFGSSPGLSLREGEETLALALVSLVREALDTALVNKELDRPFDVLNEAFGHFVRDNFRGNIEDAQYMTPPEVVEFMVEMALTDITQFDSLLVAQPFTALDPTCGVGSFLTAFYDKAHLLPAFSSRQVQLIGQDKVERMIRLTKINLLLFEAVRHQVTIGNSLSQDSPLANLNGSIDLILTNPPFGAKFSKQDIAAYGSANLPIFGPISQRFTNIDSELLFVDRNLALLKPGGRLLIIVPDSVISARGLPSLLRQQLRGRATVRAVIELPSVAFSQAGTRTKTCILYLIKNAGDHGGQSVFVAKSEDLGFEVSTRKGVQVKVSKGANDLPDILKAYSDFSANGIVRLTKVLKESPSCVSVGHKEFVENSWTPNHYSAMRINSVRSLESSASIEPIPLGDLVEFVGNSRKSEASSEDSLFVSVLHVIGEGMLDISAIRAYKPKTPGVRAKPNEILFSRINPRIPRGFVMPDFEKKTLCSSEFEIMAAKASNDPYLISFLLLSDNVQNQIRSLTSGTSASHNRIKTADFSRVLLPTPKKGSLYSEKLDKLIREYRRAIETMLRQTMILSEVRQEEESIRNAPN